MKPTNGMRSFTNDCFKLGSLAIHLVGKDGGLVRGKTALQTAYMQFHSLKRNNSKDKISSHEIEGSVFVGGSLLYTRNSRLLPKNRPDHQI